MGTAEERRWGRVGWGLWLIALVTGVGPSGDAEATHIPAPGDMGFVAEINTGTGGIFALHNLSYGFHITEVSITLGGNTLFDTAPGSTAGDVDPVLDALALADATNPILGLDPGHLGYVFSVDGTDVVDLADPTPFSIADGSHVVTLRFADSGEGRFGPGESWGFHVDYDTRDGAHVRPPRGRDTRPIDGDMAYGAISVTFDNGDTLSYVYDPDQVKLLGGRVAFPAFRLVDPPPAEAAEPSGGALLAAGLALLGLRRRRR